jgi:hypothetical protein
MKLLEVLKVEDCFDGGLRFEYRFDGEIAEPFMRGLATGARLDYFPDFPKPFFKIIRGDGVQIKGILGTADIEAFFPSMQKEEIKRNFDAELLLLLKANSLPV